MAFLLLLLAADFDRLAFFIPFGAGGQGKALIGIVNDVTEEKAIAQFQAAFGPGFIPLGVGRKIEL